MLRTTFPLVYYYINSIVRTLSLYKRIRIILEAVYPFYPHRSFACRSAGKCIASMSCSGDILYCRAASFHVSGVNMIRHDSYYEKLSRSRYFREIIQCPASQTCRPLSKCVSAEHRRVGVRRREKNAYLWSRTSSC